MGVFHFEVIKSFIRRVLRLMPSTGWTANL